MGMTHRCQSGVVCCPCRSLMSWYGVLSPGLEAGKTMKSILTAVDIRRQPPLREPSSAVDKTSFEYR